MQMLNTFDVNISFNQVQKVFMVITAKTITTFELFMVVTRK